ncbi:MAG TPA: ammonium transporter [Acidimicrobiales bacterium]|jgi:Amt family ammonium transporter|nr:ammonium transporter [Acidimicrobiales bacterium]
MNSGDTAWVLISAALVLFMTPGLALFYGGMVRSKGVLAVMMQSFICMGLVTVLWAIAAFSLSFGNDAGGGIIGNLHLAGLANLDRTLPGFAHAHLAVSPQAVMVFQMMFAVITAALISGGTVDRIRFPAFVVFIVAWLFLVYVPLAHWVFSPEGWLAQRGVLDFAGGTVVEINSGFSTLALVLVLGKRRGWPRDPMQPHSVPLSLLGAAILWFGWFGFNAGSALGANNIAVHAFVNTQLAAAAGMLGWLGFEIGKEKVATTLGAASGAVAGMVAITPCAGFIGPMPALVVGALAGVICALAVRTKFKLRYDDSLDVLGVHGVGGIVGMVLLGLFATRAINPAGGNGLLEGGGMHLFGLELLATVVAVAFCFGMSYVIAKVVDATMGLRVSPETEFDGLDLAVHAETAYS